MSKQKFKSIFAWPIERIFLKSNTVMESYSLALNNIVLIFTTNFNSRYFLSESLRNTKPMEKTRDQAK